MTVSAASNSAVVKGACADADRQSEQSPLRESTDTAPVATDAHVLYKVYETPQLHVTVLLALQVCSLLHVTMEFARQVRDGATVCTALFIHHHSAIGAVGTFTATRYCTAGAIGMLGRTVTCHCAAGVYMYVHSCVYVHFFTPLWCYLYRFVRPVHL